MSKRNASSSTTRRRRQTSHLETIRSSGDPDATVPYQIRLSNRDREIWEEHARANNLQLSQWIRSVCAHFAGGRIRKILSFEFMTDYPKPDSEPVQLVPEPPPNPRAPRSPNPPRVKPVGSALDDQHDDEAGGPADFTNGGGDGEAEYSAPA